MKMHLVARVPNEGAHRLAWWIGEQPDGSAAIELLARKMGTWMMTIDRLLSGEVTPGLAHGMAIMAVTRGAVEPRDFDRRTALTWFDEPAPRAPLAEAA